MGIVPGACKRREAPLLVAVAANMQLPAEQLIHDFQKQSGTRAELIVSSSGKLTAQIKAGAPYDLFLSADMRYPASLQEEGYLIAEPLVYALGRLTLWSKHTDSISGLTDLLRPNISHIAIANPAHAPYGQAAWSLLEQNELLQALQPKLIYAESIAQVNHLMLLGTVQAALTSTAIVHSEHWQTSDRQLLLSAAQHQPIEQGVALLKNSQKPAAARDFYAYLFSKEGQHTLSNFGYQMPNQ